MSRLGSRVKSVYHKHFYTKNSMLKIQNLQKAFAKNHVIQSVDLTIEQDALTAIIGPNGCGKSTLFNLITGELSADGGQISFNGQSLLGLRPRQIAEKGILRKFQIPGIYPNMTVAEHLRLPFIIHKQRADSALIIQTAAQMGLETLMQQRGSLLATGQKQWLELAMLVLLKPVLLLLDEPIAGMTAQEAQRTLNILHRLNQEGLTIVTIEHNIDFVKALTDDIVVMMNGGVAMRADYATLVTDADIRTNYLGSLYA